ncbi:alternative ribosome rescue aminoacyl-tRNA hydrolase ArfB [Actimicrobium sp. CCI2.3]|uniref:alternative ribosome rescue aminoacyl-tRNA hydrolase ArfB n=1 Tax=Actimicrobium sp. CCI2.3 TaxID=3048616 RepID=UPI002AB54488|nr:alternative ribosome rescue aminoacyl-tRNA hydrolase ArfB [Actimicrobium sp. CCI2.3]MDY7574547.1 alternative ribosome rescue aminoacyl-tRNA hydrolase ArfB [Actimicrobium sp. CCI2.3]MEB0020923.1 alternative ribosome rescue aminoacyl-tRNA hydrolase ArfB [Actimicrobium sp. CCI2.3]
MNLEITDYLSLPLSEIELTAIRAQGPGGQNVNKVATAIHLRFNIKTSSLPEYCRERLLALNDHRITRDGVIIIKAQNGRSQPQSKAEALRRLQELIQQALVVQTLRRATKPTRSSQRKRVDAKTGRGAIKALRGKVRD